MMLSKWNENRKNENFLANYADFGQISLNIRWRHVTTVNANLNLKNLWNSRHNLMAKEKNKLFCDWGVTVKQILYVNNLFIFRYHKSS